MLNCPLCFGGSCDDGLCRSYFQGNCSQFQPPKPITDIMTETEFREYILKQRIFVRPDRTSNQKLEQLQGQINYMQNKVSEHIDISKKKAQTYAKEREVGYK